MKAIRIPITYDQLDFAISALIDAHRYDYASPAHRQIAMETRRELAPRMLRAMLSHPIKPHFAMTTQQAELLEFCLLMSKTSSRDLQLSRLRLLGSIQPQTPPRP